MDLSIIIVSWNTRELLRACLNSVFSGLQSLPRAALKAEVFVVDNASSDGSVEIVEAEFPHAHLIRNHTNQGFAAANNQAMRLARGRHILLLNSDTVVLDNVLNEAVRYMDGRPDVGAMGCRVLNPDRTIQLTCFRFPSLLHLALVVTGLHRLPWPGWLGRQHMRGWARDSERDVEVVTGCFLLVRREVLSNVGMFDESFFFYAEETDWCRRIAMAGWKVRFAPVGQIIHYGSASADQLLEGGRGLLLAHGLVRLQRKHNGVMAALVAWLLLWTHNLTRAWGYWLAWQFMRDDANRQRSKRHWATFLRFPEAWRPGLRL